MHSILFVRPDLVMLITISHAIILSFKYMACLYECETVKYTPELTLFSRSKPFEEIDGTTTFSLLNLSFYKTT